MPIESLERQWATDRMDRELRDLSRRVRELEHLEQRRDWAREREEWNRFMWHFTITICFASVVVYSIIFGLVLSGWR